MSSRFSRSTASAGATFRSPMTSEHCRAVACRRSTDPFAPVLSLIISSSATVGITTMIPGPLWRPTQPSPRPGRIFSNTHRTQGMSAPVDLSLRQPSERSGIASTSGRLRILLLGNLSSPGRFRALSSRRRSLIRASINSTRAPVSLAHSRRRTHS